MKKQSIFLRVALSFMAVFSVSILLSAVDPVESLAKCQGVDCVSQEITNNKSYNTGKNKSVGSIASLITNTLLYFVGAFAIIMLIYGGIQYVLSSGDAAKVKKAKDTILYAVIGLAVALLAYAIVTFVTTKL